MVPDTGLTSPVAPPYFGIVIILLILSIVKDAPPGVTDEPLVTTDSTPIIAFGNTSEKFIWREKKYPASHE